MPNFDHNVNTPWGGGLSGSQVQARIDEGLRAYMLGVYNHMTLGLGITGLVAMGANYLSVTHDPSYAVGRMGNLMLTEFGAMLYGSALRWIVMLAPLAFVLVMSFGIHRLAASTVRLLFLSFAAAMGLSISSILLVYTGESVARAFFITAASFGALSLYGYTTRRDLTAMGSFMIMGLFGLILASIVNIFMASSALQFAISCLTILVFAGLTAYDTQSIRNLYWSGDSSESTLKKSVYGALTLYLDFINIFMAIVQLTGSRRE